MSISDRLDLIEFQLERIADAVERIADALEGDDDGGDDTTDNPNPTPPAPVAPSVPTTWNYAYCSKCGMYYLAGSTHYCAWKPQPGLGYYCQKCGQYVYGTHACWTVWYGNTSVATSPPGHFIVWNTSLGGGGNK